jgi:manganese transport protein
MNGAFLINAAILIVAAAAFYSRGIEVTQIQQAHALLEGVLGSQIAPYAFAVALLCAGQSSTVTGTLAGQITMEGFLRLRIRPWLRRLVTRTMAIIPAVAVILWAGEESVYQLLIFSQVVLSLQLSFAVMPLVRFTCSKQKMGPFVNPGWLKILAWLVATVILALNATLVYQQIGEWTTAAGEWGWLISLVCFPMVVVLVGLLAWMVFRRERPQGGEAEVSAQEVIQHATRLPRHYRRIGVALDAEPSDAGMLAEAIALAKNHQAELVLIHVVNGVGGTWYGDQTGDAESRDDAFYLDNLTRQLRTELTTHGIPSIDSVLGYGEAPDEIVRIAKEKGLDLMVLGGHGHRGLSDILYGETIARVRHQLEIPIVAAKR